MNKKINTICFIFILFFLISVVSASNSENETINTINNLENQEVYKLNNESVTNTLSIEDQNEKLSRNNVEIDKLQSSKIQTSKVSPQKVTLKTSNVKMYYKDGSKFTITLKDKNKVAIKNAKIKINVNGVTQTKETDNKGTITLNLNSYKSGTYTISTIFDGSSKYLKANAKNTVKIKSTIKCSDLKKIYKNSKTYSSTFYDKKGKVLKKTNVKFKLNGKTYSVKTDNKGVAKLNINLKQGKYSISIINSKTSETLSKTITITPLIIENKDIISYYRTDRSVTYKVKIINSNGKSVGFGKSVTFSLNNDKLNTITNKQGYSEISFYKLKPGTYTVKASYDGCFVSNKITIKTLIETNDLIMNEDDGSLFNVKILNSQGKANSNQKITLKIDNRTYTKTTNNNGIASLEINLGSGAHQITTTYGDLSKSNKIIVNTVIKHSKFTHSILVPNYVNVTTPYVFHNAAYTLKTGTDGIIMMPKMDLITVQINESNIYYFTTSQINEVNSTVLDYKSYLLPFDNTGIKSDYDKSKLTGNGIIITRMDNYTQIDYQSNCDENTELFGIYADKGIRNSETFTYVQNTNITAKVNICTFGYDEYGLRYNLARYYGKNLYDIDYRTYFDITNNNVDTIRYANTNEKVTFNTDGFYITSIPSKENIITKLKINGKEELEKIETISYGLSELYKNTLGFEVLQGYAIINEKITKEVVEKWVSKSQSYINRLGVINVYGMFLSSLETAWLADEFADNYSHELNVDWKRKSTTTIIGGINLENTYIHILNADMGMEVNGYNESSIVLFKLINSLNLPNFEDYSLSIIAEEYLDNTTSSLNTILSSLINGNYSTVQLGEMLFVFSEDGSNTSIILNESNGIANVIMQEDEFAYKGSSVKTTKDCCGVGVTPYEIIQNLIKMLSNPIDSILDFIFDNIYKHSLFINSALIFFSKKLISTGIKGLGVELFGTFLFIQNIGNKAREYYVDKKDWYKIMDTVTFTRPGFFEGKKIYNIPNKNGEYDYIEIPILNNLKLDRDNSVYYYSNGTIKKLTRKETYNYYTNDYYSPFSVPPKYWNNKYH